MANYVWLIPALPLLGVIINTLLGIRGLARAGAHAHHEDAHGHEKGHGDHGHHHSSPEGKLAGIIASAMVALSFVFVLLTFFDLVGREAVNRTVQITYWQWIQTGALNVPFGFLIDQLSVTMMMLVTGVGTLIHIYSIGYMSHDERPVRFFVYLNLFIVAMLMLVMGSSFLVLFLGWEGVGLCSFLLIGFWFERKDAKYASVKAFVVNRIGDFGLLLAMFAIWKVTGSLVFLEVKQQIASVGFGEFPFMGGTVTITGAITLMILLGVTGKSAQIPLYVWLPDAMAGPTPVSALIHAATMVTSGIYLMVRTIDIFNMPGSVLTFVGWIGALTALAGALIAVGQYDIKKVLAYSTVSQLGYMVAAFGIGAPVAAMFHLLTHGFFKALLFLGSGSVIHGAGNHQDMRRMGGLKDKMPITYWTFVIGALCLGGFPLTSGFWSKDEIIGAASDSGNTGIMIVLIISAMLTAFYMARQVRLVFHGEQRDRSYTAHESPRTMTVPLMILAGMSLIGGFMNIPSFSHVEPVFNAEGVAEAPGGLHLDFLHQWLSPLTGSPVAEFHWNIAIIVTLLGAASAFAGWRYYSRPNLFPKPKDRDPLWRTTGGFYEMLEEKLWLDDLYEGLIVRPFKGIASFLSNIFDKLVIDGAVNGSAWLVGKTSAGLRTLQTGYVRSYALMFLLGVVAILAYIALA